MSLHPSLSYLIFIVFSSYLFFLFFFFNDTAPTEIYTLSLHDALPILNFDGGGSTTMVVDGQVVNSPSDKTGERADRKSTRLNSSHGYISYAVFCLKKKKKKKKKNKTKHKKKIAKGTKLEKIYNVSKYT